MFLKKSALLIDSFCPKCCEVTQIKHFVTGLRKLGFFLSENHSSPICPAVIGDSKEAMKLYYYLYNEGIYTIPVVYPAVRRNQARFRFTVNALHTKSDLDFALLVLKKGISDLGIDLPSEALNYL